MMDFYPSFDNILLIFSYCKMTKFIILLFLFSFLVLQSVCFNNPKCRGKRYLCGTYNTTNMCVNVSDYTNKEFLLQPCKADSNLVCNYAVAQSGTPAYCVNNTDEKKYYAGELCTSNKNCTSNKCEFRVTTGSTEPVQICIGYGENEPCVSHSDCDTGLFCNKTSGVCQKQKLIYEVKHFR